MNTQFKKGVLEMVVLIAIEPKDKYGYQLVSEVREIIDVNEGTIYPILKRLTVDNYLSTYLVESREGPIRKYYTITSKGLEYLAILTSEWLEFSTSVSKCLRKAGKK